MTEKRRAAGVSSGRPLRILQVVPSYFPAVRYGGPIRSVHGLAAALVRQGHEVHVYTTSIDGDQDLAVPIDQPVDLDGVQVHYFRVPALRRLCWAPQMARRLRERVAQFDVVHLHSVYLWPTWAAARAAERAGVPFLLAPRGMLVAELIRRKSRWLKTAWISLIERRSLAAAAGLHVTADLETDELRALGLPMPPIFCVPNGVAWPSAHASLAAGPFADLQRPYALFLGRLNWKKGLDRLVRCWRHVHELPLVIVGNDEEGYRQSLEKLAAAEGVADRIRFAGYASDEHKWALYANAEMFLLPSYSENFGNVVAESMAMACPVVLTPEVGLATLVRETNAGLVVDGEPRALAAAINTLHANAPLRRQMGNAGRQAVIERLSWDAVGAQMLAAYRHATGTSAA
jgi:glycosyltransferase involved in cell wall biosynthesis